MILAVLARLYPEQGEFTVAAVIAAMETDDELRTAVVAAAGDKEGKVTGKSLPYAFRSIARRPAGGLRLNDADHTKRPRRYFVSRFVPDKDGAR